MWPVVEFEKRKRLSFSYEFAAIGLESVSPMIGESISHYRIVGKLGSGGMGEVYLAEDTSLRRKVAVKFLSPEKQQDQSAHFRILREARSAACLEHANICTIHEIGSVEGKDVIVMEYVEGQTLKDRLAAGPLPLEEALRIVCDIAEALEEAHEKGIIHKDLKPGNIMITRKGKAKVMDFGLAMKSVSKDGFESSADTVTQTVWGTQTGGTPAYMSPEQLLGESIDVRTDIFSLGIVFYEMLAGTHPFLATTSAATSDRILHEEPRPVSKINPAAPEDVGKLITRMMAKDPKDRPGSARELLEDLHAVRGSGKVGGSAAPWFPGVFRQKRGVTLAAIMILLLLLGGAIHKLTQRENLIHKLPPHKYLAILPFTTIGLTGDYAAFAKGLMATMNAQLTKLSVRHDLQVISASEVAEKDIHTVAEASREFGVNLVMEGNLYRVGDELRINYTITDVKTKKGLRGDSFKASMSDPFDLEDKVTSSVLSNLEIELFPEERSGIAIHPTQQPEAYNYYVTALGYLQEYQKTENVEKAIKALNLALGKDTKFAEAHAALGEARWHQYEQEKDAKRVQEALAACSKAVKLDDALAPAYACLGMVFNGTGKYEQAVHEYQNAIDLDRSSDDAYRGLASAYENLGLRKEAEETYSKAIKLKPEYWANYSFLGVLYLHEGRYREAEKQFSEVTALVPDHHYGYSNLGAAYLYEGRYSDAIVMLQHSIALRRTGLAYSNLGTAYFYRREFRQAVDAYKEALKFNERNWQIWGNLGDALYLEPKNKPDADAAYRKALSLGEQEFQVNSRNARLLAYMAYYHSMLGDEEEAQNGAKLASVDQQNPEILFVLAQTFCSLGDTNQTLEWMKKALDSGFPRAMVLDTPLFAHLRNNPEFLRLLKAN